MATILWVSWSLRDSRGSWLLDHSKRDGRRAIHKVSTAGCLTVPSFEGMGYLGFQQKRGRAPFFVMILLA